ncbi:MAG TPA: hypothetical protein VFY81_13860 [Gammaproteobacteria bacterium]|nr:hypothetical protein [Gammaproteobacteria bacterium]
MADYQRSSVIGSSLWMVGVSLVLFFLPALNGLIGGVVGGYKAGTVGRALSAAVLPAIVVFFGVWGLMAMFDHAVIGFLSGIAVGIWALISSIGLLIGALIGGAISPKHAPV